MERFARGVRAAPMTAAMFVVTVIGSGILTLALNSYLPGWWASRDRWDAGALLFGAVASGLLTWASLRDRYRRAADLRALVPHVRVLVEPRRVEGRCEGVLQVHVRILKAWTYSHDWRVSSASARVLGNTLVHAVDVQVDNHLGTDITFFIEEKLTAKQLAEIVEQFPSGGWIHATTLDIVTNHREFRAKEWASRLDVTHPVPSVW